MCPVYSPTGPGPTILGPGPLHLDLDPDFWGPQGPGPDFGQSNFWYFIIYRLNTFKPLRLRQNLAQLLKHLTMKSL